MNRTGWIVRTGKPLCDAAKGIEGELKAYREVVDWLRALPMTTGNPEIEALRKRTGRAIQRKKAWLVSQGYYRLGCEEIRGGVMDSKPETTEEEIEALAFQASVKSYPTVGTL